MSRIGIISPYPGFSETAGQIAQELGLQVEHAQAVLDRAVEVAERWEAERKVAAVIARGLTAQLIKQRLVHTPVIALEVTGYDLMQALHQARALGERIALIDYAYADRPYDLDEIRAMLGLAFTPLLYSTRIGILRSLIRARQQGCQVVVTTGVFATERAARQNLPAVVVQSNPMAIRGALLQAEAEMRQHRRVEYRDRRAQTVLETSREGIIVVNGRGRVTTYNPAAERILGLPAAQVLNRPAQQVEHPAFRAIYGGGAEASNQMQMVGGRQFVISRVPILVAGQPAGRVITFQSATAILRLEEMIRLQLHHKGLTARYDFHDIIGQSSVLQEAMADARKYARSDLTVLITGESGTGKELFAHAIHRGSPRREGAFVAVNCAALPESLLESELFGYAEGAFTGAKKGGKPGLFELAHGGSIFLDEIGELPVTLQARLLRVLQSREVMRVGGDRLVPVNVRVLAATNRHLTQAVQEGRFREDLYYRLNVLHLHVPALRERPADIQILARHLLNCEAETGFAPVQLSRACLDALSTHPWMGNVRELRNFLMRFIILADGVADRERLFLRLLEEERIRHRPAAVLQEAPTHDPEEIRIRVGTLEEMEQQILQHILQRTALDRGALARRLGISRTTLWKKLKPPEALFRN